MSEALKKLTSLDKAVIVAEYLSKKADENLAWYKRQLEWSKEHHQDEECMQRGYDRAMAVSNAYYEVLEAIKLYNQ